MFRASFSLDLVVRFENSSSLVILVQDWILVIGPVWLKKHQKFSFNNPNTQFMCFSRAAVESLKNAISRCHTVKLNDSSTV